MRIKNLNIGSFGKLSDVSIGLDDKITVIHGKNEAGKSSIATFIKYMLYGFDSSKKADVSENQKKKYMPWDSDECSGELEFESSDGKRYVAVRKTATRTQNTVFDEDNMPLTSDNAGDYFFGIGENAYKKTAFIGQKEASFTDDGELDSAIRNMVYSADESVDSRKAIKKLEELSKFYLGKTARSGKIYETEKELDELTALRDKWKDGHKELLGAEYQLAEIQRKISFNKEKRELLEKERENLEYLEAKKSLEQIENAKKTAEESRQALEKHCNIMQNGDFVPDREYSDIIKSTLFRISEQKKHVNDSVVRLQRAKENLESVYSDETQKQVFDTLTQENETAETLVKRIAELKKKGKNAKTLAIVLTCLVITLPIAIFFYIKASSAAKQLSAMAEKYGCADIDILERKLSSGVSYKSIEQSARQNYDNAKQTLEDDKQSLSESVSALTVLANKGGFDIKETEQYLNKLQEWLEKIEELNSVCREKVVAYKTLVSSVNADELLAKASKYDETLETRDIKTVTQQLSFYTQANDALTVKERELERQAAVLSGTLPKPSEIQSKILSLTALRDEMAIKHSALTLAVSAIEKASESMRSEAAPRIAAETSELFSKITGGKYRALYADNEMNLTFLEKDEAEVRDAGYLSEGTLDAAYISLRIALCEFLYKEHPTLIFDDAFANMDNERLKNTLDFLVSLSEDFQIVILSCHDREKEYLNGKAKIINFEV
ncbi:MAG: hypothetical protein E7600_01390 [Ruminococcaceae bacterium]|nr:hypothetical protein [Oscillospiraceae bacterium]